MYDIKLWMKPGIKTRTFQIFSPTLSQLSYWSTAGVCKVCFSKEGKQNIAMEQIENV